MGPKMGETLSEQDLDPESHPPGSKQIQSHPPIVNFSPGLLTSCHCLDSTKRGKEADQFASWGKGLCRYLIVSTSSTF